MPGGAAALLEAALELAPLLADGVWVVHPAVPPLLPPLLLLLAPLGAGYRESVRTRGAFL